MLACSGLFDSNFSEAEGFATGVFPQPIDAATIAKKSAHAELRFLRSRMPPQETT